MLKNNRSSDTVTKTLFLGKKQQQHQQQQHNRGTKVEWGVPGVIL